MDRRLLPHVPDSGHHVAASDHGGNNAAVIFTLTQTAKLNSLDVEAYLRHIINVIPDHPIMRIDELLPWNVKL
jgi:transposase